MRDIFTVPFIKIFYNRTFWFILFISILMAIITIWATSMGTATETADEAVIDTNSFFYYPQIWQNMSFYLKTANQIICIILMLLISSDLQNNHLKQHIIDGWSRDRAWLSYTMLCGCFALFSVLLSIIFSLVLGIDGDYGEAFFSWDQFIYLLYSFMEKFMFFQIVLLLTLIIKKTVPTLLCFWLYTFFIEGLGFWILEDFILEDYETSIKSYTPGGVRGALTPLPKIDGMEEFLNTDFYYSNSAVILGFFYIFLFGALSRTYLKRADI